MLPEYIPSLQYKWPLRKIIPIHFTVFKVLITVSNVWGDCGDLLRTNPVIFQDKTFLYEY